MCPPVCGCSHVVIATPQWRCWDGRSTYSRCAADARRTLAVRRLISGGCSFEEAAAAVRCSTKTVQRLLNTVGGMPPRKPTRSKRHLSLAEREEVSRGLGSGASYRAIARRLGRAPSTISREVHGNGGPRRYRACRADEAAYKRARRPKATKFRQCSAPHQVESMLNTQWSPQQISARLPVTTRREMRVSRRLNHPSLNCSSKPGGRCAKSSPRVCGQGVPVVARMGAKTQGATSKRWSSSRIDRLRSKTVRCLVIGKAT